MALIREDMMTEEIKTPIWFWAAGILAVLWNGLGVGAYIQQALMSAEQFAALTEIEQQLIASQPFWHSAAFPVAVLSGFLGSIFLLLKKRLAVRMFLLSLIAVTAQFLGYFILDGYMDYISSQGWVMPVLIPIVAVILLLYSSAMERKGLLR
ncbi:hypothetical protein [Parasphingorhabdus sp.]|uniref:hypothetical protein n=1 Tax=Parasphingorhabdus sp. TaxID=2709688 RepID=UPI003D272E3E